MTDDKRGESRRKTEVVAGPSDIPDIYVNATQVTVGVYDVTLQLSQELPKVGGDGEVRTIERRPAARIRMSHAQAWTAAHITLRLLSSLVREHGCFLVTSDVLERLHLRDEYHKLQELADVAASD